MTTSRSDLWPLNDYERRVMESGNFKVFHLGGGEVFIGRDPGAPICERCGRLFADPYPRERFFQRDGVVTVTGTQCVPLHNKVTHVNELRARKVRRRRGMTRMAQRGFGVLLVGVEKDMRKRGANGYHIVSSHTERWAKSMELEGATEEDANFVANTIHKMLLMYLGVEI